LRNPKHTQISRLQACASTLLLLLIENISPVFAEDGIFKLTSGVDYSTGKYGQQESTDITCIPFTGKYEVDRWTLKLTVPWIKIVGNGVVTGNDALLVSNNNSSRRTSESGLGDVVSGVTYTAIESAENGFILDTTGKIKFGTASYQRGLGTGENDYTVQIDAYKIIEKFTLMGTLGYKKLGDPDNYDLYNVWFGSLGVNYKFDDKNSGGTFVDLRQRASEYGTNLREYTVYYSHKFNQTYKLQTYLSHGDTRSSADWGGGIMLGYTW
jgi:hypothetical protein